MVEYACIAPHPPVIIPEVAGPRIDKTRATIEALEQVARRVKEVSPESAIVISPHGPNRQTSFGVCASKEAHGGFSRWGAPEVQLRFPVDHQLSDAVLQEVRASGLMVVPQTEWGTDLDWGCTVPLYHLRSGLEETPLCLTTVTGLSPQHHYRFGQALGRAVDRLRRRVVLICSADLSHCLFPGAPAGYDPSGEVFDAQYQEAVKNWDEEWMMSRSDTGRRKAAEDAVSQTAILMGAVSDRQVQSRVLSYEGPFGVGYLVAEITLN